MRTIHPFPARMAPQIAIDNLQTLKPGSRILDPMCGSGTVIRAAVDHGHDATGLDLDPLATLIAATWCNIYSEKALRKRLNSILEAKYDESTYICSLECEETRKFIHRWFAPQQIGPLSHIAVQLSQIEDDKERAFFSTAMSRIIITKTRGASLAWDISHSRPHLKKTENDFDVLSEFNRSASKLIEQVIEKTPTRSARIELKDCRKISSKEVYDAVITSPPYLNAIDYLRGHKFSLVWLNHTISNIRIRRSQLIGTERKSEKENSRIMALAQIENYRGCVRNRTVDIIEKYADDCFDMIKSIAPALKSGGRLILVVGNSTKDGTEIRHDNMFEAIAAYFGLTCIDKVVRPLELKHRYLPYATRNAALKGRMKEEIVLQFAKS